MTSDNHDIYEERKKRLTQLKEKFTSGATWWFIYPVITLIATILLGPALPGNQLDEAERVLLVIPGIVIGLLIRPVVQFAIGYAIDSRIINIGMISLTQRTESLAKASDFFSELVAINFKYIDQYYKQTQEQANKSFYLSATAAFLGFGLICVGVGLMYSEKSNAAYIAAGAGVISQFISSVFFYLYNKTVSKMSNYHKKLVLTQNVSLALKITEELPDDKKANSQIKLIEELTGGINKLLVEEEKDS